MFLRTYPKTLEKYFQSDLYSEITFFTKLSILSIMISTKKRPARLR